MEKRGKNYFGLCPFHDEKTPSFSVSPEKNIAVCMGCGKGGKPITFYQQVKNISFAEAARELGKKLGITVSTASTQTRFKLEHEAMKLAAGFYQFTLYNTPEGQEALKYLYNRGLNDETIKHFEIGLANNDFQALSNFLLDQKFEPALLIKLGLITKSSNDDKYYDIFNYRIIFPIKDKNLNVIGFSGRSLESNAEIKYINSSETPLFKKGETLYHLYEETDIIKERDEVILFEGFFDVISAYQIGYKNGVATMGTALTDDQARMIRKLAKTALIAYDGDQAGIQATNKAIPKLKNAKLDVNILLIPGGMDPDDYIRKHQTKGFQKLLEENVKDSYRYYYDDFLSKLDRSNANSVQVFQQNVNLLFKDAGDIVKKMFQAEISELLGFDFVFKETSYDSKPLPEKKVEKKIVNDRFANAEISLICDLLRTDTHLELIKNELIPNIYVRLENYEILEAIINYYNHRNPLILSDFKALLSDNLREYLEREMNLNTEWVNGILLKEKTVQKFIKIIKEYDIQRKIDLLVEQMDEDNVKRSLENLDEITRLRNIQKQLQRKLI